MNSRDIAVTASAFTNSTGYGGTATGFAWCEFPAGAALRWRNISGVPYDRFGRLDRLSKLALIAVETLELPQGPPQTGAICMATGSGCVDVDFNFSQTINACGGPSPLLFTYTLPSSAMAEIAIRHRITGPTMCFMAGSDGLLRALHEGASLIQDGEAETCLCVAGDAVSPEASSATGMPMSIYAAAFHLARADRTPTDRALAILENSPPSRHDYGLCDADELARNLYRMLAGSRGSRLNLQSLM